MDPTERNAILHRTGSPLKFKDVSIGQPFFSCNTFWVRIDYEAAAELCDSAHRMAAICAFGLDSEPDTLVVEEVEVICFAGQGMHKEHP